MKKKNNSGFSGKRNSAIFIDTSKKDFSININKNINKTNEIKANENINIPINNRKRNSLNISNMFMYGKKSTIKNPICFAHLGNLSLMDHSNNASRVNESQAIRV